MSIHTPVSLTARERLRDHQSAAAKAIAGHSAALARLDKAISRRSDVLLAQDALVARANSDVAAAVASVVAVTGADTAAGLLGLSKAEIHRLTKAANAATADS